ncbi:hypothetical protein FBEOM_7936 [Fusarium beomiforme]|uniref:Uncharacterized protein n=1 Tax=Fusarium beomiforme TaxID=44412 RepID=A0A9P5AGU5_9HYPO|nr:hypothetical protein FBEOM_7936 [Fusarium beomiforme]
MAPTCLVKQKTKTRAQIRRATRSSSCSSLPSSSSSSISSSAPRSPFPSEPSSSSDTAASGGTKRSSIVASNERPKKRYKPQPDKGSQMIKTSNGNKMKIEVPLLKDFTQAYGIPPANETAAPPSVPNAYQKYAGSRRGSNLALRLKNANHPPVRHKNCVQRGRRPIRTSSPPKSRPRPPIRTTFRSPRRLSFMGLPAEVREQIYRGLLVSQKGIPVYDGWRRVYQREKPGLHINILMVSKKVFAEARGVLYGENTFLYRLRDAPTRSQEMINIQDLANDDVYVPEPGMRDQENNASRGANPLAEPIHEPGTIDTAKYAQDFRFITVKADHNRSSWQTKEFMADAIKMFAKFPDKTNIHTLKIIISPEFAHGKFTFVDFFEPASELMVALKSLPCEIIHVQISNQYLNNGVGPSSTDLILRAHQLRFYRQLALQEREDKKIENTNDRDIKSNSKDVRSRDLFRTDAKMQKFRYEKLCLIKEKMLQLNKYILQTCEKQVQDDVTKRRTKRPIFGDFHDVEDDWDIHDHDELEEGEEDQEDQDQDFEVPSDNDNDSDYEG